jgi:hypothetical protein
MPWRRRPVSPSARCITTSEARTIWWRPICPARDQPNLALFKRWFAEADGELPDKVEAIFRNLARSASHPKWKGCGFLRTSVELTNMPGHPAMKIGAAHKKSFEDWLRKTFEAEEMANGAQLAWQILPLLDGSFAQGSNLHGDGGPGGARLDRSPYRER